MKTLTEEPVEPSQAVAKCEVVPSGDDPLTIIAFAIQQRSDSSVISQAMAVREQLMKERALRLYNTAMREFQKECPVILKEKGVPDRSGQTAYKYAPKEAIEVQIKPFEVKHGFSHNFPESQVEPGWITVCCKITHDGGHSELHKVKFPLGTKTAIMSDTQHYAATETFCQRRALCAAYGLTIAGEDIDGSTGKLKPSGPSSMRPSDPAVKELAGILWALLEPVRGEKKNWDAANQWLWREEILDAAKPESAPNLTADRFKKVIELAKARLAK